jgi:hypothetical protein
VKQLHHRVGGSSLDLQVVDRDHVGVRERGHRAGLLLQAPERAGVHAARARQHLDGDLASQAAVAGAVDLAHAASAEELDDLVEAPAVDELRGRGAPFPAGFPARLLDDRRRRLLARAGLGELVRRWLQVLHHGRLPSFGGVHSFMAAASYPFPPVRNGGGRRP